ncbi:MAG: 50S ribosomal protein L18Ae [Hadesarchaea archaeon]|nr:50S ribosomal protein L18Ae [Hadesarchaea archaeon]
MPKLFRVKGWFEQKGRRQRFARELPGLSQEHVIERILSELGSRHKVKRNLIHIEEITEVEGEGDG